MQFHLSPTFLLIEGIRRPLTFCTQHASRSSVVPLPIMDTFRLATKQQQEEETERGRTERAAARPALLLCRCKLRKCDDCHAPLRLRRRAVAVVAATAGV